MTYAPGTKILSIYANLFSNYQSSKKTNLGDPVSKSKKFNKRHIRAF